MSEKPSVGSVSWRERCAGASRFCVLRDPAGAVAALYEIGG